MPDPKVILVVDDEPYIVDMIAVYLQIKGYTVRSAYNGQDGLTMVRLEKPDALLLDLMLPDIEGFEICERVRAMPDFAQMPILVVSARADPESKARAEQVGANGYLTKPVKMAELVVELEKALSAVPSTPPEPPAPSAPPVDQPGEATKPADQNQTPDSAQSGKTPNTQTDQTAGHDPGPTLPPAPSAS